MELKNKKYIKNTGTLPGFKTGLIGAFSVPEIPGWLLKGYAQDPDLNKDTFVSPWKMIRERFYSASDAEKEWLMKEYDLGPVYTDLDRQMRADRGDFVLSGTKINEEPTKKDQFEKKGLSDKLNVDNIGGTIGAIANAGFGLYNSFQSPVKSNDLVAGADTFTNYTMGVPYTYKSLTTSNLRKGVDKQILGDWFGNIGRFAGLGRLVMGSFAGGNAQTGNNQMQQAKDGVLPKYSLGVDIFGQAFGGAVGGILGGWAASEASRKADKEFERADRIIDGENTYNANRARLLGIQNVFTKQHGDTRALLLYKNGTLPKFRLGVASSKGKVTAEQDSWVSPGEGIIGEHSIYEVPGKPNKKDNIPAHLGGDGVLSYEAMQYFKKTGDLEGAFALDLNKRNNKYCNGKLPKHSKGETPYHTPVNLANLGLAIGQYISAAGQPIKKPNTYVRNTGLNEGLRELGSLRLSSYPILPELYNQYAKSMYAISNSGGLSGGQKTLARLSALNNLLNNYAKLLQSNQMQNNAYRQSYADSLLKYGAQDAQDRANALRYDLDYYSKAHAARQSMMNDALTSASTILQKQAADDFKWKTYNETRDLYRQQLSNDQKKTAADIANMDFAKLIAMKQNSPIFINPFALAMPGVSGLLNLFITNKPKSV